MGDPPSCDAGCAFRQVVACLPEVSSYPAEPYVNGWTLVQGCAPQDAAKDQRSLEVLSDAATPKKRKGTGPVSEERKAQMARQRLKKKEELEQLGLANTALKEQLSFGFFSSFKAHCHPLMFRSLLVLLVVRPPRFSLSMHPTLLHPTTPCSADDADDG